MKKVYVTHLAYDKEKFNTGISSTDVRQVQSKYALGQNYILFLSTLKPSKNIEGLIEAYASISNNRRDIRLIIAGKKGWLYGPIFEKIKLLNLEKEVIFTDYVAEEDLPYFYNLADVFVLASLYEGFGLPIIEAMACGCPVVTSNKSSMPEIAGDAALLVDALKIEEIAAAIERIITEPELRATLVKRGFEQVKKFSWKTTAEKTIEIYKNLL